MTFALKALMRLFLLGAAMSSSVSLAAEAAFAGNDSGVSGKNSTARSAQVERKLSLSLSVTGAGERQRLLPLQGAYNVRDLGGYQAAGGTKVKWGKIFRSGDLNRLTENDLAQLAAVPVRAYIDFRTADEIAAAPDRAPSTLVKRFDLSIAPGSLMDLGKMATSQGKEMMEQANAALVRDFQDIYSEFFSILLNSENVPVLFHCSAGKDRTGFAAMLFLAALGVDRETIMEDYMLSAEYLRDKYSSMIKEKPYLEDFYTVRSSYLLTAFEVIDKEYGGVDNYLTRNLRVDIPKLRRMYAE